MSKLLYLETNMQAYLKWYHKAVHVVKLSRFFLNFIVIEICLATAALSHYQRESGSKHARIERSSYYHKLDL